MAEFTFNDYARATLEGASNLSDGSALTNAQVDQVTGYLTSPGSGPDSATSFAAYVVAKRQEHPAKLANGLRYISFSGLDSGNLSNYASALAYGEDTDGTYGALFDTPWGRFIEDLRINAGRHPDFQMMAQGLKAFMDGEGVVPFHDKYAGALQDMMWNAGCAEYIANAVAAGVSLLALVENAPRNGSFNRFELATLMDDPQGVINGYPVSAIAAASAG